MNTKDSQLSKRFSLALAKAFSTENSTTQGKNSNREWRKRTVEYFVRITHTSSALWKKKRRREEEVRIHKRIVNKLVVGSGKHTDKIQGLTLQPLKTFKPLKSS